MRFATYSANREWYLHKCKYLQYHDKWAYNYTYNDILPYWDENNYWGKFPIKIGFKITPTIPLPGDEIVGGIAYTFENEALHIKRLFTCKKYRNKGVANRLLEEAWYVGYHKNCKCIRMWCDKEAIPFYKKLGYKFLGFNKEDYGYVYLPILTENMSETLNKTKDLNPYEVLKDNNIELPEEANLFLLNKINFEGV